MTAMFKRGAPVDDIARQFGVQSPAVYKALRRTGALPPYGKRAGTKLGEGPTGRAAANLPREKPAVRLCQRVERDPCTFCGVRGDIGCQHQRRSALPALPNPPRRDQPQHQGA